MDKQTTLRIGVAGAVAAAGLAVGGVAIASAEGPGGPGAAPAGYGGPGGPGGHGGPGFGMRAGGPGLIGNPADLAKELGVSTEKLRDAMQAVMKDRREDKPDQGDRPDRAELKKELTAALAKELGISEDKVTAALEKVQKANQADRREGLEKRLDAAVKDGKLTSDDKRAVLKAYDAGVLGGPK